MTNERLAEVVREQIESFVTGTREILVQRIVAAIVREFCVGEHKRILDCGYELCSSCVQRRIEGFPCGTCGQPKPEVKE